MPFIDREEELRHLNELYQKDAPQLVVIYGRRRVGKTTLLEEFLRGKEDSIYYLADQQVEQQQVEDFKRQIFDYTGDEFLLKTTFRNWDQLFSYLTGAIPKDKRITIAIDELTYIIKSNPAFPSILQKYWDRFFSKSKVFLVVSGSLVGLMLKKVLNYGAPLYGRRTSQIHLGPFNFEVSSKFLKKGRDIEERMVFYSITGGVAKYLVMVEEETVEEFLRKKFLEKEGFFYQEGIFLLSQEFKNLNVYLSVLKAIAAGNTQLGEISNSLGMEGKKVSRYLDVLQATGLVEREVPVTEDPLRSRKGVYKLRDNYLRFWFRFIFPNRSRIEIRDTEPVLSEIKSNLPLHVSQTFEEVCAEFLAKLNRSGKLPLSFSKLGPWWYGEEEIDLVALDEGGGRILLGECKWQDEVDAERILWDLRRKSETIRWGGEERKEYYAVFAKSFKRKAEEPDVMCFDLSDIEKFFEPNQNRTPVQ
jgi:AAA+ ATPase superfamily predicted ATPase